jgi:hypothetical protein
MLLVSACPVPEVERVLAHAGAFPVLPVRFIEAPAAAAALMPAAVVVVRDGQAVDSHADAALQALVAEWAGPFLPLVDLVMPGGRVVPGSLALPVAHDLAGDDLVAVLARARRVRATAAAARRRGLAGLPRFADALDDATLLVAGRGAAYPALSTRIGEAAALVGVLRLETVHDHLAAREIDGIVIGDGFGAGAVEALLERLSADPSLRHMPVAVLGARAPAIRAPGAPPFLVARDPAVLCDLILPHARLAAHAAALARHLEAANREDALDPATGLHRYAPFLAELDELASEVAEGQTVLSCLRIDLPADTAPRVRRDLARMVARLVRDVDIATADAQGGILIALGGTDLRMAQVVARRLGSIVRHSLFEAPDGVVAIEPDYALVAARPGDTAATLTARLHQRPSRAA